MTGPAPKPKGKPRGRPFQKGADPRRANASPIGSPCPSCGTGRIIEKAGRFGTFAGCDQFPRCHYSQPMPGASSSATPEPEPHAVTTAAQPSMFVPSFGGAPSPAPADAGLQLATLIQQLAGSSVNREQVQEIVSDALGNILPTFVDAIGADVDRKLAAMQAAAPRPVAVSVNGLPPVQLAGAAHSLLPRVLGLSLAGANVLLVGPAGCGKTFLGEQVAEALGRSFATLSCAPGLPESALLGRRVPNLTTGVEVYHPAPFVTLYRDGGVFLLDEVDNADASTMLVLNSALANGHMTLPDGSRVERHADFVLIASANTYGHGQSREYVGRTQLDAAFLDRFAGSTLSMDYDEALEAIVCPEPAIREAVQAVRRKARELRLRRVVSTRGMLAVRRNVIQLGDTVQAALQSLAEGWTPEDRRALGVD